MLRDLVRAELVPDVLREEVEIHRRELRIGHARRDLDRPLVDRPRSEVLHRRVLVQPLLVTRARDVPDDVLGGQRRPVRPLEPLAEGVRVRLPVVRRLPRLGEPGDDREVVRRLVRQRRVVEVPRVVVRDLDAGDRVEGVDVVVQADREDDLVVVRLGGGHCGRRPRAATTTSATDDQELQGFHGPVSLRGVAGAGDYVSPVKRVPPLRRLSARRVCTLAARERSARHAAHGSASSVCGSVASRPGGERDHRRRGVTVGSRHGVARRARAAGTDEGSHAPASRRSCPGRSETISTPSRCPAGTAVLNGSRRAHELAASSATGA